MSLKQKTISGVVWNGMGNIARQALMILTLIVMARYLSPDDFGVFSILMIFVSFMNIFSSMGTSQAVIHIDNPDQCMLSTIFYFNIAMGVAMFGLLFLLSWPIAAFFDNPQLVHLLQIIGFVFILTTMSLVQKALLEKEMQFERVIKIETTALTISSILGILGAVNDLGVYSFIVMALSNAAILTLGLWMNSHWFPSFEFSFANIKKVWSYSVNLTGSTIINYFARQADHFLIGKFIGSGALGLYSVAYKIMLYPLENVSRVIVRVLFPAFSELKQDNERFKQVYVKAITYIALITFPLMGGVFAVADHFVSVVFGDKWSQMTVILMILVPIGLMQSIVTTVGSVYMAKGSTNLMFKIGLLNAFVTVLSFIVGVSFGLEGIAIAYAVANLVMLYPNLKVCWRQIDLGVYEGLSKLSPFFISSILMSLSVYLLGLWMASLQTPEILLLILQIVAGVALYLGFIVLIYKQQFFDMIKSLRLRGRVA